MEKRKAHYSLKQVFELIDTGAYRVTRTALLTAAKDFGFIEPAQIAACVRSLKADDFYKSMTTIHDSRLWQDVYRPEIKGIEAYVKIQIVEEATVVISFKEREG
jgi:motility quorum-sensing regulator / GCU-specific mRNA interferase toxin